MPICPNCGSYVPLGDHSCSCGTTLRYEDSYGEEDSLSDMPLDNPYSYDFLNELYHNDFHILCLNQMEKEIAEIEKRYSAKFRDYITSGPVFILSFDVEEKYFDAIIRASYDSSYAYNYVEIIEDIVTPDLSKLYSCEEFRRLVREKEKELGSKFVSCKLRFLGGDLCILVSFEGLYVFFLNGKDLVFRS